MTVPSDCPLAADREGAPLIVLPGALGLPAASDLAPALTARRAVRVIGYRGDDTLAGLVERVMAAADQSLGTVTSDCPPFDLLGQSYGGWIAQCVARIWPERVRRLVLAHSFALEPGQRWRFRLGRALLRRLPRALAGRLLLRRAAAALAPVAAVEPERHRVLLAALAREVREPDFWDVLAAQQLCMAQSLEPAFAALPPVAPAMPVLILESANDPLVGAGERAALRRRLSRARVHRFEQAGHVSALAEREAFAAAVAAFLDQAGPLAKSEGEQGR